MASFASFVSEGLVNFELARGSFVALGAIASQFILVSFVRKGNGALLVFKGHYFGTSVGSDSNIGTDKHQH